MVAGPVGCVRGLSHSLAQLIRLSRFSRAAQRVPLARGASAVLTSPVQVSADRGPVGPSNRSRFGLWN